MIPSRALILLAFALLLISCGPQQDRTPAVGQAFVGPATLNLRQELSTKAPVSAVVHHGEPLDILEYKRKFIKVRTAGGIVGWTDVQQLLTPEQMSALRHLAENAASYPSQGIATPPEQLNVHTEPNRTSPTFLQIAEGGKVDIIGHRIAPRTQAALPTPAPPPRPKPQRRRSKDKEKEKAAAKVPPPPPPPAPAVPSNWLELSRPSAASTAKAEAQKAAAVPAAPVPKDDWSLIRTKDGRVGWVLSRMVNMAIPDDVAQYAEGHRITSYFALGNVDDDGQVKHNWLWTTIGKGPQTYEFDSFRFFIWSKRHRRYETAFIQRDVVGYYPIEASSANGNATFSVILENDDGKLVKKTYSFNGYRVNHVDSVPYARPAQAQPQQPQVFQWIPLQPDHKNQSWYQGLKDRAAKLFKR